MQDNDFSTVWTEYSATHEVTVSREKTTRIYGMLETGTLPTGVASFTCYRKSWQTGST